MDKVSRLIGKVIETCLLSFMVVLVTVTFLQVLARFVFKIPISWSQELVKLCFVWIIFLGSAIAVREGTHLTLDMFTSGLPDRARKVIRIGILLLMIVCAGTLLYGGGRYCINCASKTMITLPLPADVQYVSMPLAALFMIWYLIEKLRDELTGKEGAEK